MVVMLLSLLARVRTGDVRRFNDLMSTWERAFITKGTYLLMEKCLMLVYRNLVKKMSVSQAAVLLLAAVFLSPVAPALSVPD